MTCSLNLKIHAAKSRVCVLVMCLKPVAECRPQHACRSTRRAAFHNEVLAIKKIGRVTTVKRKRLKSREGREDRRSPLPSVPQHSLHTEGTLSLRKSINWRGIPSIEVEITQIRIGSIITPR